jgi:hypothetical protein
MRDYIALTYGGIPEPSGKPLKDAKDLAEKCLNDLPKDNSDKYKFPPKLLILLTSPDFINHGNNNHYAEHLLAGIHNIFNQAGASPSLIGSSVAGVFFDKEIHSKGALLICLASQLIDVEASYEKNAREQPERVVETLLSKLKLLNKPNPDSDNTGKNSSDKLLIDPNPLANKVILTFMPGCKPHPAPEKFYPAPELHHWLYEKVNARIMITGGVSSADDVTRKKDGYQFCEKKVLQDSIVAASITTGVPIGIGLNDALVPTRRILRTKEVNGNGRTIRQFYSMEDGDGTERSPCEELEQIGKVGSLMFAKLSSDDERMLDLPLKVDKKGAIE